MKYVMIIWAVGWYTPAVIEMRSQAVCEQALQIFKAEYKYNRGVCVPNG